MGQNWGADLLTIDKDSSVPIYVQIVDRVQALITVGTLKPGDRLPSIRGVAEHLRVDYNTVARAYTELDRAGMIKTARGVGTHVTGVGNEEAVQQIRQDRLHNTLLTVLKELIDLGYSRGEIVSTFESCVQMLTSEGK